MNNSIAGRVELVMELLGKPSEPCPQCGQMIPEVPPVISNEQAIELLNMSEPPIDVEGVPV